MGTHGIQGNRCPLKKTVLNFGVITESMWWENWHDLHFFIQFSYQVGLPQGHRTSGASNCRFARCQQRQLSTRVPQWGKISRGGLCGQRTLPCLPNTLSNSQAQKKTLHNRHEQEVKISSSSSSSITLTSWGSKHNWRASSPMGYSCLSVEGSKESRSRKTKTYKKDLQSPLLYSNLVCKQG